MPKDTSEIGEDLVGSCPISLKAISNIWFIKICKYIFKKKINSNESNIGEKQDPLKCLPKLQKDDGHVMEAYYKVQII